MEIPKIIIVLISVTVITILSYYYLIKEPVETKYSTEKIKNKLKGKDDDFIIPRNIIQSFSSRYVTERMKENIENWLTINEEYSYTYFDENEIVDFITKYYSKEHLKTFYKINAGAGRADFFRYLYLYKFGGLWVDVTLVCDIPLRKYIKEKTEMVVVHDISPNNIYNAFMGFPKNHPILKNCIEKCIEYVKNETYLNKGKLCIFHTTGPEMIKKEYLSYFSEKNKEKKNVVILKKKFSFTKKFFKTLDTYYNLYVYLEGEIVMKTKFDYAREDLQFVSQKKHYRKLGFFNKNQEFIDGILKLKNITVEKEKEITILIRSSGNLNKLNKFYDWVNKTNIAEKFNVVLIDDFLEKNELLETYYKLEKIGIKIKINPIKFNKKLLIETLNLNSLKLDHVLYLDEEKGFDINFLEKFQYSKKDFLNLEKYIGVKSLFFHKSMINDLQEKITHPVQQALNLL